MDNQALANSLRRQISSLNNRIAELTKEIAVLSDQQERLQKAKHNIEAHKLVFAEMVLDERRRASNTRSVTNARIATSYAEQMTELLTGNDFRSADASFDEILKIMSRKATEIRHQIYKIEHLVAEYRSQVDNLQSQLRTI
ncbi:MAG: hypothetical protein FWH40_09555 [Coriobacteriia bacterium]|nr:hypothetical protein [Coriobacteriia bacterium]